MDESEVILICHVTFLQKKNFCVKKCDGRNSDLESLIRSKSGIRFENCNIQPYYFDKVLPCCTISSEKNIFTSFFKLNGIISNKHKFPDLKKVSKRGHLDLEFDRNRERNINTIYFP